MRLTFETFEAECELIDFVKNHYISKQDIQSIVFDSSTEEFVLFYWE